MDSCRKDDIDALTIALAQAGRRVVRLEGRRSEDFRRAGEEIAACRAAGIGIEVVPGIAAAAAASRPVRPPTSRNPRRIKRILRSISANVRRRGSAKSQELLAKHGLRKAVLSAYLSPAWIPSPHPPQPRAVRICRDRTRTSSMRGSSTSRMSLATPSSIRSSAPKADPCRPTSRARISTCICPTACSGSSRWWCRIRIRTATSSASRRTPRAAAARATSSRK